MHSPNKTSLALIATVSLLCLAGGTAEATILGFNNLTGTTGDPFTSETEQGFTVTGSGSMFQNLDFGNPAPSVFLGPLGSPTSGSLTVTNNSAQTFTFQSLDFASTNGPTAFTIQGFDNGTLEFTQSGTFPGSPNPPPFTTLAGMHTGVDLTSLVISLSVPAGVATTSANIDNIVVDTSAVPEPGYLGLLATLGSFVFAFRKLRRNV